LDEVGDIPLELQAKLLRVLQEQEFERLGSNRTHKVDVRLIAATHRDLSGMVKQSTFREDLYYRLKVFPITVPALRQRIEDIPKLVRHFTEICAKRMNKRIDGIPSETMDRLVRYTWPGNARELQNFIERAVILSPHSVLRAPTSELEPFNEYRESTIQMTGLEEYVSAYHDPARVHGICEEYRAAATIDVEHDRADKAASRRIECPMLHLWAQGGPLDTFYAKDGGTLGIWRQMGSTRTGTGDVGWPLLFGREPRSHRCSR